MLEITIVHANALPTWWMAIMHLAVLGVQFLWILVAAGALRIIYEYTRSNHDR